MKTSIGALRTWLEIAYLLALAARPSQAALAVSETSCEYAANPLGVEAPSPRFGWVLQSVDRGQTSRRIAERTPREGRGLQLAIPGVSTQAPPGRIAATPDRPGDGDRSTVFERERNFGTV